MMPKDRLLVAESGINSWADIVQLKAEGAGAFLIGEALMRGDDIGANLRNLLTC
jgi:indole-3-glycerol phosphate synthase